MIIKLFLFFSILIPLRLNKQDDLIHQNLLLLNKQLTSTRELKSKNLAKVIDSVKMPLSATDLEFQLDNADFCSLFRNKLFDHFSIEELSKTFIKKAQLSEQSTILLAALSAHDSEEAIEILKNSDENSSKFFQALFLANSMSKTQQANLDKKNILQAIELLDEIIESEPHNTALGFYKTVLSSMLDDDKTSIIHEFSQTINSGKYFNKYWESIALAIGKSITDLPMNYQALALHLYGNLNYPDFHWEKMKNYIAELDPDDQLRLGEILIDKSMKNSEKPLDQYWSPTEHQYGRQIINSYYKLTGNSQVNIPHYTELDFFKKKGFKSKKIEELWDKINDSNQKCPLNEIYQLYQ